MFSVAIAYNRFIYYQATYSYRGQGAERIVRLYKDGWMDGWMVDGWMEDWKDGWKDGRWMDGMVEGRLEGWMVEGCAPRVANGRMGSKGCIATSPGCFCFTSVSPSPKLTLVLDFSADVKWRLRGQ